MLQRLFPKSIDNHYQGSILAIVLLVPILLMKGLIGFNIAGLNPLVGTAGILKNADGVPLDSFGAGAAARVIFSAATWGLAMLLFSLLGALALIRYRAMIPLVYLLLAAEQIGRKAMSMAYLSAGAEKAGGVSIGVLINWGFTAALLIGLALSLTTRKRA